MLRTTLTTAIAFLPMLAAAAPGDTEWISIKDTDGQSAHGGGISVSDDGRYVAFQSTESGVSSSTTAPYSLNVYVRDRVTRTNELVNVGLPGDWFTGGVLSGDGRYVLFASAPNDPSLQGGLYLRDRVGRTTTLLYRNSYAGAMSRDARYVAFESSANTLVSGDTNGVVDVFLRDRQAGTVERVSVATSGAQATAASQVKSVSADGRFVVFTSEASNLSPGDTNAATDVFVRDRLNRTTTRVSARADGTGGNGASYEAVISADGRWIAFASSSSDLVPGDTNNLEDTFVRDLTTGQVERVSVTSSGAQLTSNYIQRPSISDDGRYVAFASTAPNIVSGDTNRAEDVFVRDRLKQATQRVSLRSDGEQANGSSFDPVLTGDARFVIFTTYATNLDPRDTRWIDTYIHERADAVPDTLVVQPVTLKFGGVTVGTVSAIRTVTVTNSGSTPLALPWIGLLGRDPTQFRRVRHCPTTLAAGASCTIDVRFAPTSAGSKQARIVVSTGKDGIKKTVWLSGTGT